ncbi:MAG TPA: hypothetical protein VMH27_19450 [Puia sp.]|nr:hypothetical protein [Puia sp.]
MNLKAPPLYILAFLILAFLVQELHDWAHFLMVRVTCHCWPLREFGSWVLCGSPSAGQHALIAVSGPVIDVVLLLAGWSLLNSENSPEEHSLGVALVFAALPLKNLIEAFGGYSDITQCVQWLQRHGPMSNRGFARGLGLVIVLLLNVPPLVRAFFRLPGYKGKLIAFPLLFLLPDWLDRLSNHQLNKWLIGPETGQWQAYALVGGWLLVLTIGFFLTRRQLKGLIRELSL